MNKVINILIVIFYPTSILLHSNLKISTEKVSMHDVLYDFYHLPWLLNTELDKK